MSLIIERADLHSQADAQAICDLLQSYAMDPLGGGIALSPVVLERVIPGLQSVPGCVVLLGRVQGQPAGVAITFRGFSTWRAAPLINLHDLAVHPQFRGQGIGRKLLQAVESLARETGCCRVTLEVRTDNEPAQSLYRSEGFQSGEHPQEFWIKHLG